MNHKKKTPQTLLFFWGGDGGVHFRKMRRHRTKCWTIIGVGNLYVSGLCNSGLLGLVEQLLHKLDTTLTASLPLTLLPIPAKFGEEWIWDICVRASKSGPPPPKVFLSENLKASSQTFYKTVWVKSVQAEKATMN